MTDLVMQKPLLPTMRVYEVNYLKLMRLVPGRAMAQGIIFSLADGHGHTRMVVVDSSAHTSTVVLQQQLNVFDAIIPASSLTVRVYHDARMAEVVSYQNESRLLPKYPVPNAKMYLQREKCILNEFLTEWLDSCFKQKRIIDSSVA